MTPCLGCLKDTKDKLCVTCQRQMFGAHAVEPHLVLLRSEVIAEVRERALRMSLGGAQPKASVRLEKGELQIVGTGGRYLLKPSTEQHPFISENEHFCMNVVRALELATAPFCLISLRDGEYAFLTKRFDREPRRKRHIEDFASVLELPAESKYSASYLDVLRASDRYCRDSGLERIRILKLLVVSYALGNNDLHLKNFSLIDRDSFYALAPAYDVVCAKYYYPNASDLALELEPDYTGSLEREGYFTRQDFLHLAHSSGLHEKQAARIVDEVTSKEEVIFSLLERSYLPSDMKRAVSGIIQAQLEKLRRK